jgi:hypothetical protein
MPALQVQSPEFKLQSHQKQKQKTNKILSLLSSREIQSLAGRGKTLLNLQGILEEPPSTGSEGRLGTGERKDEKGPLRLRLC